MLLSEDTNSAPRKKQRTLFAGPGTVQVKLVDERNRVHYLPVALLRTNVQDVAVPLVMSKA